MLHTNSKRPARTVLTGRVIQLAMLLALLRDLSRRVESAGENFTPRKLTEPYVTLSPHTALDHSFDARSKYQWTNRGQFGYRKLLYVKANF